MTDGQNATLQDAVTTIVGQLMAWAAEVRKLRPAERDGRIAEMRQRMSVFAAAQHQALEEASAAGDREGIASHSLMSSMAERLAEQLGDWLDQPNRN